MRERFARFMAGRYGNDRLNFFLLASGLALIVLGTILKNTPVGPVFTALALASIVFTYFRMFSKNRYKRAGENEAYLRFRYKALSKLRVLKEQWVQRKDSRFFFCPSCRTALRVPKGRGKIRIICRKCGTSFERKT